MVAHCRVVSHAACCMSTAVRHNNIIPNHVPLADYSFVIVPLMCVACYLSQLYVFRSRCVS